MRRARPPPGDGQPQSASASSSSSRRSSSTRRAPSSPPTARPQSSGRPTSTARAPRASATSTSVPAARRRPSAPRLAATASTTSGSASMLAGDAVELAAAVVGDDHPGGAVLDRERARPRPVSTPLTSTGSSARPAQRLEVAPGERWDRRARRPRRRDAGSIRAASPPALGTSSGRDREAGPQVALAAARRRGVDGQHDRLEPGLDRLVDQRAVTPRSRKQ